MSRRVLFWQRWVLKSITGEDSARKRRKLQTPPNALWCIDTIKGQILGLYQRNRTGWSKVIETILSSTWNSKIYGLLCSCRNPLPGRSYDIWRPFNEQQFIQNIGDTASPTLLSNKNFDSKSYLHDLEFWYDFLPKALNFPRKTDNPINNFRNTGKCLVLFRKNRARNCFER